MRSMSAWPTSLITEARENSVTRLALILIGLGVLWICLPSSGKPLPEAVLQHSTGGLFGDCASTGESCDSMPGDGCTGSGDDDCLYCDGGANVADLTCAGWIGLCTTWTIGCGKVAIGECIYPGSIEPGTGAGICQENGSPTNLDCDDAHGCFET